MLLFYTVWVLAGFVGEGVLRLGMVWVLMRRRVLHHISLVWMLMDIWILLIEA